MLEIEIKVKITDAKQIADRIIKIGGQYSETLTEDDTYFNSPSRDFGQTDEALRVRITENKSVMTYKGPKNTLKGSKVREEFNVTIDNGPYVQSILKKLGSDLLQK